MTLKNCYDEKLERNLYPSPTHKILFIIQTIMKSNYIIYIIALLLLSSGFVNAKEQPLTLEEAKNTIGMYCAFCHNNENPQAGLNLVEWESKDDIAGNIGEWNKIVQRLQASEMPPPDALQPTIEEREALVEWIKNTIQEAVCADGIDPGPSTIRRLNRGEYSNTIRDLFDIHFNAGSNLPHDGGGGAGFDNAAEALFISPVHMERYLESAKEVLNYAMKDENARLTVFAPTPKEPHTEEESAVKVLEKFAYRAFRRPVQLDELAQLMSLYRKAKERNLPHENAVFYALQAVLISPHFLFLIEEPNLSDTPKPVSDYELASRLSYFLWNSTPDEKLLNAARDKDLHDEDVLLDQVDRMLDTYKNGQLTYRRSDELEDRRYFEFAQSFMSQWLGFRELGRDIVPDQDLFPVYDQELEYAMKWEPVYLFQDMIQNNRPLTNLIDADFTYVNRDLSKLYNFDDDTGIRQQQLKRITLPQDHVRGGVMTMASVLAVSSYSHRTSPVLRGKWVLETILGSPPPPPPPNVPELEENQEGEEPKTLRERLMKHRENPVCASCHDRIDPIGFGLENFDVLGRWRDEDAGQPIDSTGTLPNGKTFHGPEDLKQLILERKDDFVRHFTAKMLGYALGRSLVTEDYCTIDHIVEQLKRDDYRTKTLIYEIVKSVPFRYHPANEEPIDIQPPVLID